MPPQSLSRDDLLSLGQWAPSLRIRSMFATGLASLMRAAASTVTNWQSLHAWLEEQTMDHGSLLAIGQARRAPVHWRTQPV
eukprot:2546792-Pyramimonas_sp.AAC.1